MKIFRKYQFANEHNFNQPMIHFANKINVRLAFYFEIKKLISNN